MIAVQRRAQLVAHHGQELRLELVNPPQLGVHLGQGARLSIASRVLVAHLGAVDEDAVALVQPQKCHRGHRHQPVGDHDRGRAGHFGAGPHPDRGPDRHGDEDEAERDAERFRTARFPPPDGDDDQGHDAQRRGRDDDVGER